jgi:hypothetical protein
MHRMSNLNKFKDSYKVFEWVHCSSNGNLNTHDTPYIHLTKLLFLVGIIIDEAYI